MSEQRVITIERHIIEGERAHPGATGGFSNLLRDLMLAMKVIYREVSRAGLTDVLGLYGSENVHGDKVTKLDMFANDAIFKAMDHSGHLCVMASEENEEPLHIPDKYPTGNYVLLFDPLDGSSNIDANVSVGTIFSIYRRISRPGKGTVDDCLQPGYKQIAAGYVLYGPSMMLVLTTGDGVDGFTYEPGLGEFLLSDPDIRIPRRGKIYSVNEGYTQYWDEGVRAYVDYVKTVDKATGRPYTSRYVGSMVADIHRTLLYGGIFMYPSDSIHPSGKLRLVYEANPMGMLIEQAGGKAIAGPGKRLLDVKPETLHQRTPLYVGSEDDITLLEEFMAGRR